MEGWLYNEGSLHCDGLPLQRLREELGHKFGSASSSPVFVYSHSVLVQNVARYTDALKTLGNSGVLSYSLKANHNPTIVSTLREAGVTMVTCVSGNELQLAIQVGFKPHNIILNGNGKRRWEVEAAVRAGSLLNVDSIFDGRQILEVSRAVGVQARVLLRLNPAIDAHTHPYLATALAASKFGVEEDHVPQVLKELKEAGDDIVTVEGVHIHVGSAISEVVVYSQMMVAAVRTLHKIHDSGWPDAWTINLGGGLNVSLGPPPVRVVPTTPSPTPPPQPYTSGGSDAYEVVTDSGSVAEENDACELKNASSFEGRTEVGLCEEMTPAKLVASILPMLPRQATLVLEPGRSLVATAGVLVTEVLGIKDSGGKRFVVVDAAMTEVIRPALYGAAHPITPLTMVQQKESIIADIVGPVCESGDFLARDCALPHPLTPGSSALAVWGVGAYCAAMASNYNLRPRSIEVLVHGSDSYEVIRRPQLLSDIMKECVAS